MGRCWPVDVAGCCPSFLSRFVPSAVAKIHDCTHFALLLGMLTGLGLTIPDIIDLVEHQCTDIQNCVLDIVNMVFLLPCTLHIMMALTHYDDRFQTRYKQMEEQKTELREAYSALLKEMDGMLARAVESSAELAEKSFQSHRRDFVHFLESCKSRFGTAWPRESDPEGKKFLEELREHIRCWLAVFKEVSVDPLNHPLTLELYPEELGLYQTVQSLTDEMKDRLWTAEFRAVSLRQERDKQAMEELKGKQRGNAGGHHSGTFNGTEAAPRQQSMARGSSFAAGGGKESRRTPRKAKDSQRDVETGSVGPQAPPTGTFTQSSINMSSMINTAAGTGSFFARSFGPTSFRPEDEAGMPGVRSFRDPTGEHTGLVSFRGMSSFQPGPRVPAARPSPTTRRYSWIRCGGSKGCCLSFPEPESGVARVENCFPMAFGFGCCEMMILGRDHLRLLCGSIVGIILILYKLLCNFWTLEAMHVADEKIAQGMGKAALGISPLIVYVLCLWGLLAHIERISELIRLEEEVKQFKEEKENVNRLKADMADFWGNVQRMTDLWLYRTIPRLELLKELQLQLANADPSEVIKLLATSTAQLRRVEKVVGTIKEWQDLRQRQEDVPYAQKRVSVRFNAILKNACQGPSSGSASAALAALGESLDAELRELEVELRAEQAGLSVASLAEESQVDSRASSFREVEMVDRHSFAPEGTSGTFTVGDGGPGPAAEFWEDSTVSPEQVEAAQKFAARLASRRQR